MGNVLLTQPPTKVFSISLAHQGGKHTFRRLTPLTVGTMMKLVKEQLIGAKTPTDMVFDVNLDGFVIDGSVVASAKAHALRRTLSKRWQKETCGRLLLIVTFVFPETKRSTGKD